MSTELTTASAAVAASYIGYDPLSYRTTTIAASGTTSAAVDLQGTVLCSIFMPAAFNGTQINILTAKSLNGTYQPTAGSPITVAAGVNKELNPDSLEGYRYIKLQSVTTQDAERELTLGTRAKA
jgi:hypothetical protein